MESASGFVRFSTLSREQRSHMLVQERGNFTIWSLRSTADTTDSVHVPEQYRDDGEENSEEETLENDATVEQSRGGGATALLENMRLDQNAALAAERWLEANQIQQAIMVLLEATSGPEPEGLTLNVTTQIRNVFQRLFRWLKDSNVMSKTCMASCKEAFEVFSLKDGWSDSSADHHVWKGEDFFSDCHVSRASNGRGGVQNHVQLTHSS